MSKPAKLPCLGVPTLKAFPILLSESEISHLEEVSERIGKSAKQFGGRALAAAMKLRAEEKGDAKPTKTKRLPRASK